MQTIQMHFSRKQKTFLQILCAFFKSTSKFWTFSKKMTIIGYVFPKLRTPKSVVRKMSKMPCLRGPINRKHGNWAKTLIHYRWQNLYHIYWSLWDLLRRKKSLLVTCKVLRLFVNTLTADDKYSLVNWDNWMQTIQMHFSEQQKKFPLLFFTFLKST